MKWLALSFVVLILYLDVSFADTPANCTHNDLMGDWNFHFTQGGNDRSIDCSKPGPIVKTIQFKLHSRREVRKLNDGQTGHFNLIYNQGFEVIVGYRKMFAFFQYKALNSTDYDCDTTMYGWSHDSNERDWSCFYGEKVKKSDDKLRFIPGEDKKQKSQDFANAQLLLKEIKYTSKQEIVDEINNSQKSWQATSYDQFNKLTYSQLLSKAGYGNGPLKKMANKLTSDEKNEIERSFPRSLDWRNVGGVNFVSPIRNQAECGSCYAFASMGMLEARVRVMTNNTEKPVFSPQAIVSCSRYAQGCEGGFPYLIAGKHAQDFGVVLEECYPYEGKDTMTCTPKKNCTSTYVAEYGYVGGYYGGCSEHKMIHALLKGGPLAVAIEVYEDFMHYKGGIYHHVETKNPFFNLIGYNPFELTNHAVLLVGYGETVDGDKYWIVKNSWGEDWGENGYVRIRRGTDEIAIESLAQESFPIPKL